MSRPAASRTARRGPRAPAPWQPLLGGAQRREALGAVRGIAQALAQCRLPGPTLSRGHAGVALFLAYAGVATGDAAMLRRARRHRDRAFEAARAAPMGAALFSGIAGVGFAAEHLWRSLGPGWEHGGLEELDRLLLEQVQEASPDASYDLTFGLVGIGLYALERLPVASAASCLQAVVRQLSARADRRRGVTWWTAAVEGGLPRINLGLAHGVPGAIGLLAASVHAGIATAEATRLLDGAVPALLRQRLAPGAPSAFAYWAGPGVPDQPARLGWCYGDLGISLALALAGRALGRASWRRAGLALALGAARRRPDESEVVDAGLCHGATGIGHLLHRMHRETGHPALRRRARYWFARALSFREPGRGLGGYEALVGQPLERRAEGGLLEGASGVGLALLAAASAVEPRWDALFLASLSDPRRSPLGIVADPTRFETKRRSP